MEVPDFPNTIVIELTNICNLKCHMCFYKTNEERGYMGTKNFAKVIDEIHNKNPIAKTILFYRGESLCHPQVKSMISYAKDKLKGKLELATNGLLLDDENIDFLLENLTFLSISIDTGDRKLHSIENAKVIENVENLIQKANTRKVKGEKIPDIQLSTVDVGGNKNAVARFKKTWQNKVTTIRVYEEHSIDGVRGKAQKRKENREPCNKLWNEMVIYWNGNVGFCCYDWGRKSSEVGNVLETSIEEVWKGKFYEREREEQLKGQYNFSPCNNCDMWR